MSVKDKEIDKNNINNYVRKNLISLFIKLKCIEPVIIIVFQKPIKNKVSNKLIRIKRDFKLDIEKN